MKRRAALAGTLATALARPARAATEVDLQLVLAVDVSRSIDEVERASCTGLSEIREVIRDHRLRHRLDSGVEAAHGCDGVEPRDVELEALGEIIEGKRLIHCHSYRQDEILAFLRSMESFGVRVASLQHVLEGYKIADEIAAHGAGASTFSDWWAYKMEVQDAIPHNGALLHKAGVLTSFNSDDDELARRLNTEAAKAVKYGAVPPEEAIKFVTLNPAKSLEIEEQCQRLLTLQQPMASDLRAIMTAIRLNWDLERAGDLVCNICKTVRRIFGSPIEPKIRGLIAQMSDEAFTPDVMMEECAIYGSPTTVLDKLVAFRERVGPFGVEDLVVEPHDLAAVPGQDVPAAQDAHRRHGGGAVEGLGHRRTPVDDERRVLGVVDPETPDVELPAVVEIESAEAERRVADVERREPAVGGLDRDVPFEPRLVGAAALHVRVRLRDGVGRGAHGLEPFVHGVQICLFGGDLIGQCDGHIVGTLPHPNVLQHLWIGVHHRGGDLRETAPRSAEQQTRLDGGQQTVARGRTITMDDVSTLFAPEFVGS